MFTIFLTVRYLHYCLKDNNVVTVHIVDGEIEIKDQVRDYVFRGDALENWSYLDYFLGTYDGKFLREKKGIRGRPANECVPYRPGHGRKNCVRIVRSDGHETMPYFPGQWFPKRKREDENGLFEASMLALLRPWRSLLDLKSSNETFHDAFDRFVSSASEEVLATIQNIEFFHDSSESAQAHQNTVEQSSNEHAPDHDETQDDHDPSSTESVSFEDLITEHDIRSATDSPYSACELLYAETAIGIGLDAGALHRQSSNEISLNSPRHHSLPATEQQLHQFSFWKEELKNLHQPDEECEEDIHLTNDSSVLDPIDVPHLPSLSETEPSVTIFEQDVPNLRIPTNNLNKQQTIAHDIVVAHLQAHLNGEEPPQRLMIVHGQGGTGKSELLNAITHSFDKLGASHLLARTAMTGVAASIVNGQTLHSWAALPAISPGTTKWITHPSKTVEKRRTHNIAPTLWLTIDEMSMLTTPLLVRLSQVTGFIRGGAPGIDSTIPFGGLCVLLLGDFHQFPPVANTANELYNPSPETLICRRGRDLFLQFDIVIKLEEQMRMQDAGWTAILQRSRDGECTDEDVTEIRKLVLTNPECEIPDFSLPPWDDAILVTPRNSVRTHWNERKVLDFSQKTKRTCYVVYASDTSDGETLTKEQRLAIAHLNLNKMNRLPNKIELVVGMKAMVLENVATDADLANGTRGTVVDIILDPREDVTTHDTNPVILQFPPAAILFAPYCNRGTQLRGLPKGTVPLFPSRRKFRLGGKKGTSVERNQFPLTPAYAFTDFKSQGQTIENVIVDLAKTPSAALNAFNAYVTLSRSRGRKTIRLLRDFDNKLFTVHPDEQLRLEDERLTLSAHATLQHFDAGSFGNIRKYW